MGTIKSFEVDRWSKKDETGGIKHLGMLKRKELFELLEKHLVSKDMLPDEYFLAGSYGGDEERELPDYDYALCIPNFGESEGIYLDISLVYDDECMKRRELKFATGKTLDESADAFLKMARIAAECSLMLNGRGSHYTKSCVEVLLNPRQALCMADLLEGSIARGADEKERALMAEILKQLACVDYVPVMAVSRQGEEMFSLWLHDMPDVRIEALLAESPVRKGKLEELVMSLPNDDGLHLYLLRKGDADEYCMAACDIGEFYNSVHEQEGRRLSGTKEEIIHEIKALGNR